MSAASSTSGVRERLVLQARAKLTYRIVDEVTGTVVAELEDDLEARALYKEIVGRYPVAREPKRDA